MTKNQPLDNPAIALAAKRSKRRSTVPPRRAPMCQVSKSDDDDNSDDGQQLTKLPRLIFKKEVIELCGVTFPTICDGWKTGRFRVRARSEVRLRGSNARLLTGLLIDR